MLVKAGVGDDDRVLRLSGDSGQAGNRHVAILAVIRDVRHAVLRRVDRQISVAGNGADALGKGSVRIYGDDAVGHAGSVLRQRRR